jgi:hypothetical protein
MPTLIEHFGFGLSLLNVLREGPKHLTAGRRDDQLDL